jgi:hypothetical protein
MTKFFLKGRLKGNQIRYLSRLLDMLYTPTEIAREIGCARRQFYRVYLPAGSPNIRKDNGSVWINGAEFRKWYRDVYKKTKLAPDEVYCLACKRIVKFQNPECRKKGSYVYWLTTCPSCGKKVSRAVTNKRDVNDQSQQQTTS